MKPQPIAVFASLITTLASLHAAEAAQWFILVSDDRPMSVSSNMITVSAK
jgi:hypothetical protein